MAIARTGTSSGNNTASSLTISHTNSSGADQFLVVSGWITATTTVTGITHNGVSMTALYNADTAAGPIYVATFVLKNPGVGTYNVVITRGSSGYNYFNCMSWSDVDQTTPYYNSGHVGSTTSTTQTVSLTATSADDWVYLFSGGQRDSTANTNVTRIVNAVQTDSFDSNGTVGSTSARDYKIDVASPGSDYNYLHYFLLKKAGAAATQNSNFLMFMN